MMVRKLSYKGLLFLIVALCFALPTFAQQLTFSDEFDGVTLDLKKWDKPEYNRRNNAAGPDGWWLKEDSFLDGQGHLIIRTKKISNRNSDSDAFDYSTGAIRTFKIFEQKFGKFEIRCQLPTQPGWWVAFWLYSTSVGNEDGSGEDGTEIDIFEGFGWTDVMQHALHWDGYGDAHQSIGSSYTMEGIRDGYHTFALEWYENLYIFFIDGVESWRTTAGGVSKVPAYVKITGELSTEDWAIGNWWSNDPATATYPDSFLVDYVRVYKLDETISTQPDPNDHLAYKKTATSSSRESTVYHPRKAVDGNISTRWASQTGDPQWFSVDLGESYAVNKVVLNWAKAYGKEYKIEVAETAAGPWTECVHITNNAGPGLTTHEFPAQTGRYVRMYGIESGTQTGYSLYEMAVYGAKNTSAVDAQSDESVLPDMPELQQNYPNPFNSSTVIRYALPTAGHVRLTIYNLAGQKMALLTDGLYEAGLHSVEWNAGSQTSGLYFYRLEAGDMMLTKKLVVQK